MLNDLLGREALPPPSQPNLEMMTACYTPAAPRSAPDFERQWRIASTLGRRTTLLQTCAPTLGRLFRTGMEPELLGEVLRVLQASSETAHEEWARSIFLQLQNLPKHAFSAILLDAESTVALEQLQLRLLGPGGNAA